ncbi:hypothetical protein CL650_002580, partial [bacterium]|nr:hypothetical protein [bacterium]
IDEEDDVEIICNKTMYIPTNYIESPERRLFYYKKISLINNKKDYLNLIEELLDKFGPIPEEVQNLANISLLKIECKRIGIKKIIIKMSSIIMTCKGIEKMKEGQIKVGNISNEPKHITQFLENKKDIKDILKTDYEIKDGEFIIINK